MVHFDPQISVLVHRVVVSDATVMHAMQLEEPSFLVSQHFAVTKIVDERRGQSDLGQTVECGRKVSPALTNELEKVAAAAMVPLEHSAVTEQNISRVWILNEFHG